MTQRCSHLNDLVSKDADPQIYTDFYMAPEMPASLCLRLRAKATVFISPCFT